MKDIEGHNALSFLISFHLIITLTDLFKTRRNTPNVLKEFTVLHYLQNGQHQKTVKGQVISVVNSSSPQTLEFESDADVQALFKKFKKFTKQVNGTTAKFENSFTHRNESKKKNNSNQNLHPKARLSRTQKTAQPSGTELGQWCRLVRTVQGFSYIVMQANTCIMSNSPRCKAPNRIWRI